MTRKIEAVIFDWAGTTVDYGSFAPLQAFVEAFEKFGVVPTQEEVREPMGMLKWNHIQTMMQMPRIQEEWKKVNGKMWEISDVDEVYKESEKAILHILSQYCDPKPYVVDTVEKLKDKGIKIGSTTGYTDEMMQIVVENAKRKGYSPDMWITPNAVNNIGRPHPYMIFRNLETLRVSSVTNAIKVGDTVADIKEGKSAGLISVGIIEGSSIMGLKQNEYEELSSEGKKLQIERVRKVYEACGADYVIQNMAELCNLIENLERHKL